MIRLLLLSLIFTGCTHHIARMDYSQHGIYASQTAGNKTFQDVGPVSGSKYSWIWVSCEEVAQAAVREMMDEAKAMGANTVYNVRFSRDGIPSQLPTCERQWGWLLFAAPFPISAHVTGMAAKISH